MEISAEQDSFDLEYVLSDRQVGILENTFGLGVDSFVHEELEHYIATGSKEQLPQQSIEEVAEIVGGRYRFFELLGVTDPKSNYYRSFVRLKRSNNELIKPKIAIETMLMLDRYNLSSQKILAQDMSVLAVGPRHLEHIYKTLHKETGRGKYIIENAPRIINSRVHDISTKIVDYRRAGIDTSHVFGLNPESAAQLETRGLHLIEMLDEAKIKSAKAINTTPALFSVSPSDILYRLSALNELNISAAKVANRQPDLLLLEPTNFRNAYEAIATLGYDQQAVKRIIEANPEILEAPDKAQEKHKVTSRILSILNWQGDASELMLLNTKLWAFSITATNTILSSIAEGLGNEFYNLPAKKLAPLIRISPHKHIRALYDNRLPYTTKLQELKSVPAADVDRDIASLINSKRWDPEKFSTHALKAYLAWRKTQQ